MNKVGNLNGVLLCPDGLSSSECGLHRDDSLICKAGNFDVGTQLWKVNNWNVNMALKSRVNGE